MSQVLQDFTTFLGAINFDCSNGRMDYIMEGNKMVFKDASVNKMYEAYRVVLGNGYKMGLKKGRIDALNDISIHCIKSIGDS